MCNPGNGKARNGEIGNGKREMEKWVEMEFLRCKTLFICIVIEGVAEHTVTILVAEVAVTAVFFV